MSDLRSMFKSKDFVINFNIVKCIKSLDISLDEFLLILYFINISCELDTDDIKDKLGFDEETAFNTFNSLLNKKYIEMDVKNNNGTNLLMYAKDAFLQTGDTRLFEFYYSKGISVDEKDYTNVALSYYCKRQNIKQIGNIVIG